MSVVLHAMNPPLANSLRRTRVRRVGLAVVLALLVASLTSPAQAVPTECTPGSAVVSTDNVLTFDNPTECFWVVPAGVTAADVLVVGGGGSGAVDQFHGPGAGGAGGLIYRAAGSGGQVTLVPGDHLDVRAGAGGAGLSSTGVGNDGSDSYFDTLVGEGGGGGGDSSTGAGRPGGSGGGASQTGNLPGIASGLGDGHDGGSAFSNTRGGGGGGAGSAGSHSTAGAGVALSITGATVSYAQGGAGLNSLGCSGRRCNRTGSRFTTAGGPPLYGSGGPANSASTFSLSGSVGRVIVRFPVPAPAPGTPGTPTAIAGNARATVVFTAPVGGETPTSYTARVAAPGDTSKTCTLSLYSASGSKLKAAAEPALSCAITGLSNGTAYTFETKASNGTDSGWSAPSNTVIPVAPPAPPTAPAAPTEVTAVAGPASLTVSWSAVSDATGYIARADPGPATCTTTTATSCTLGAISGTSYRVTVSATSDAGTSEDSAPSTAVTALDPEVPPSLPPAVPATLTTDAGAISLTAPGTDLVIVGLGFAPYSTVTVILYSTPIELGTGTTDGAGRLSLSVQVPADVAAGSHTFLASGVDPSGGSRLMALPITVAPTDTGGDDGSGSGTLPVPAGGTITLLDGAGLAVTMVVIAAQGTYTLDAVTGVITFVPVAGFVGTATPVTYRITDALGTVVTGTYTAVVTAPAPPSPPAGKPTVKLPKRIISSIGKAGSASLACRISRGTIARCTVTATAVVSGRAVSVGQGVTRTTAKQSRKHVTVRVALNALGRSLAARPGGRRFTFTAVVVQRGRTGSRIARGTTTVLARKYTLPRSIHFATGSASVGRSDAQYLRGVRAKLAGATVVTCIGHADSRGSALGARQLSTDRAKSVSAILTKGRLTKGRKLTVHIVGKGEKAPTGRNTTDAGRARNRRVDVIVHN
ncbi:MAG TPA: OmpA family protein [Kineosporiaceae bacterium]|nr:OmpA family protein [Kineosporiaceae bacterium]